MSAEVMSVETFQIYRTVTENNVWNLGKKNRTIHLYRWSSVTTSTQKWERIQIKFNSFNYLTSILVWHKPGVIPNSRWEEKTNYND